MTYPADPKDMWKTEVQDLQAASHLPLTLACIATTEGPVLEIGVGFHSTPLLHSLLAGMQREFVSAESDPYWREVFEPIYALPRTIPSGCATTCYDGHHFVEDTMANLEMLATKHWSVVLVDDSPGYPRCENVKLFLPVSDYVLVHDAQGEDIMEPMRPIIKDVPHQFMHKRYFPWTLALSLTRAIPHVP